MHKKFQAVITISPKGFVRMEGSTGTRYDAIITLALSDLQHDLEMRLGQVDELPPKLEIEADLYSLRMVNSK